VAVLAMAFFVWSSLAAKVAAAEGDDEGNDGLETVVSMAQTLSRKSIFPSAQSVKAIESNVTVLAEWKDAAHKLVSAGDRVFEKTTTAAFKAFIVDDAKRLGALPGAVNGVLVKSDFAFGPFKGYIAEGKMPLDSELALLQRRWDDVAAITEILAAAGIAELVDVQFNVKEQAKEEEEVKPKKGRRNARAAANAKNEKKPSIDPAAYSYVFTFTTRPVGFVKVLNALETGERFTVVEDFSFVRERDVIAEALGGDEKKEAAASSRRGRRGRRGAVIEEEKKEEAPKSGIVTDPVLDAPFKVKMTVSVYDFKSLEETKSEEVAK
jgi:hypothetical protein